MFVNEFWEANTSPLIFCCKIKQNFSDIYYNIVKFWSLFDSSINYFLFVAHLLLTYPLFVAIYCHLGFGVIGVVSKFSLIQIIDEKTAINWFCPLAALFAGCFSRARTRRKKFLFFHHYLSLFSISDIIQLSVSKIDRVIDA